MSVTVSSSSSQLPTEVTSSATYKRKVARRRRTNILLTSVSLVFFLAWAPIHLFLVIMDTLEPLKGDEETVLLIYACCHLTAMTTACVNPLLYGWCNNNFKGVITTTSTTSTAKRINCSLVSCYNEFPLIDEFYSRFRAVSQNSMLKGVTALLTTCNKLI